MKTPLRKAVNLRMTKSLVRVSLPWGHVSRARNIFRTWTNRKGQRAKKKKRREEETGRGSILFSRLRRWPQILRVAKNLNFHDDWISHNIWLTEGPFLTRSMARSKICVLSTLPTLVCSKNEACTSTHQKICFRTRGQRARRTNDWIATKEMAIETRSLISFRRSCSRLFLRSFRSTRLPKGKKKELKKNARQSQLNLLAQLRRLHLRQDRYLIKGCSKICKTRAITALGRVMHAFSIRIWQKVTTKVLSLQKKTCFFSPSIRT